VIKNTGQNILPQWVPLLVFKYLNAGGGGVFPFSFLNPSSFGWAKSLLESIAWKLIVNDKIDETSISFSLPKICPSDQPVQCSSLLKGDTCHSVSSQQHTTEQQKIGHEDSLIFISSAHLERKLGKVPLVISEVRRSERINENHQGFKPQSCMSKKSFCCSSEARTLSSRVIRNLGTDFCKISAKLLSDDDLKKKSVPKKPTGIRTKQDKEDKNQIRMMMQLPKRSPRKCEDLMDVLSQEFMEVFTLDFILIIIIRFSPRGFLSPSFGWLFWGCLLLVFNF
jgi:hypothetical protein